MLCSDWLSVCNNKAWFTLKFSCFGLQFLTSRDEFTIPRLSVSVSAAPGFRFESDLTCAGGIPAEAQRWSTCWLWLRHRYTKHQTHLSLTAINSVYISVLLFLFLPACHPLPDRSPLEVSPPLASGWQQSSATMKQEKKKKDDFFFVFFVDFLRVPLLVFVVVSSCLR